MDKCKSNDRGIVYMHYLHVALLLCVFFFPAATQAQRYYWRPLFMSADTLKIKKALLRADNTLAGEANGRQLADSMYNNIFDSSKALQYLPGMIQALMGKAGCFFYKTEYDSALHYLNRASNYNKSLAYSIYTTRIEVHMGAVYTNKGLYHTAMQHYFQALASLDEKNAVQKGPTYQNIAGLLLRLNRASEALTYLNKAEQLAKITKNQQLEAIVLINKAEAYESLGNKDTNLNISNELLLKALPIARVNKWTVIEEGALVMLAKNALTAKKNETALAYIETAEDLHTVNEAAKVAALLVRGNAYINLNKNDEATKALEKALPTALINTKYLLPEIYAALTTLNEHKGNYKSALKYSELSRILNESIIGDKVKDSTNRLQFKYETAKKDNEIIKKEIQIDRQKAVIRTNNIVTYCVVLLSLFLMTLGFLLFKYRQRILKHKSQLAIWRSTMKGEENERTRIAKELHDNIGGSLSNVRMWFGNIGKLDTGITMKGDFEEALHLLDSSIIELRNTAHHLMPELLLRLGLEEALAIYCNNVEKASGIKIEFQHLGFFGDLENSLALIIYRTIQELIQNTLKHAKASFILVQLSYHGDMIIIAVEDNGVGFNTTTLVNNPGMGLQSLSQSVQYLKGQLHINSTNGTGCAVYIELPLGERNNRKNKWKERSSIYR